MALFGKKNIVILGRNVSGTYQKIGKKKANLTDKKLEYKGTVYPINFDKKFYEDGNKTFYLVDIDKLNVEKPVDTAEGKGLVNEIPLGVLKMVVKDKVIGQLVARMGSGSFGMGALMLIMTIAAGIFVGYFLGSVMPYEDIARSIRNFHW